jgi:hypothetical protein
MRAPPDRPRWPRRVERVECRPRLGGRAGRRSRRRPPRARSASSSGQAANIASYAATTGAAATSITGTIDGSGAKLAATWMTCHEPPNRLHAAQNESSLSRPGTPVSGTSTRTLVVSGGSVGSVGSVGATVSSTVRRRVGSVPSRLRRRARAGVVVGPSSVGGAIVVSRARQHSANTVVARMDVARMDVMPALVRMRSWSRVACDDGGHARPPAHPPRLRPGTRRRDRDHRRRPHDRPARHHHRRRQRAARPHDPQRVHLPRPALGWASACTRVPTDRSWPSRSSPCFVHGESGARRSRAPPARSRCRLDRRRRLHHRDGPRQSRPVPRADRAAHEHRPRDASRTRPRRSRRRHLAHGRRDVRQPHAERRVQHLGRPRGRDDRLRSAASRSRWRAST